MKRTIYIGNEQTTEAATELMEKLEKGAEVYQAYITATYYNESGPIPKMVPLFDEDADALKILKELEILNDINVRGPITLGTDVTAIETGPRCYSFEIRIGRDYSHNILLTYTIELKEED